MTHDRFAIADQLSGPCFRVGADGADETCRLLRVLQPAGNDFVRGKKSSPDR